MSTDTLASIKLAADQLSAETEPSSIPPAQVGRILWDLADAIRLVDSSGDATSAYNKATQALLNAASASNKAQTAIDQSNTALSSVSTQTALIRSINNALSDYSDQIAALEEANTQQDAKDAELQAAIDALESGTPDQSHLIGEIAFADIDLANVDTRAYALQGTGCTLYKVKRGTRIVGIMQMFSTASCVQITQVFLTNEILESCTDVGSHTDDAIHLYRRKGDVTTAGVAWGTWEEQVANSTGSNEHVAISQKAATDAINAVASTASTIQTSVDSLTGRVADLETNPSGGTTDVLPFDYIDYLSAGSIRTQSYSLAYPLGSPAYMSDYSLIFDATSRSFVLKVPTEFADTDEGEAIAWTYYAGWDATQFAYGTPTSYSQALDDQNQALFVCRNNGKLYRYEANTLIAVSGSGEGGGSDVSEEVINQLIANDSAMADRISALEAAAYPVTVSLTASSSLLEYTGSAQTVTITRTVKRQGSNVASINITASTVKSGVTTISSDTTNPLTLSRSISTYGTTSFSASATAYGQTATASCSVRMELPMYFGFDPEDDATALSFTGWTKQSLKTSPSGTYTLMNTFDGDNLWLCVPSSMTINSVKSGGFDVPMNSAVTVSTSLGNYKCYRSAAEGGLLSGSMTITIA